MTHVLSRPRPQRRRARTAPRPTLDDVQHFVLENASWELYESLLREIGDRPIRINYDQGRLEMMSPLPEHELPKRIIGRMIEMLTFELDMPMCSYGSTTFRRDDKAKGLEPDECYYFKNEKKMRGRRRLNLKKDPAPELVVEVDVTSRSVDRQVIYAALGVPEIWRYDGKKLECLELVDGGYRPRKTSIIFPFLTVSDLARFVKLLPRQSENTILRKFLAWARDNGWLG